MKAISYIEIDVPFCANTYGVLPCTASLSSSPPTGTRKCFNTPNTCQDRVNYIDAPKTLRFSMNNGLHKEAGIDCIPSITGINYTPATLSLGKDIGQRASLSVTFEDHPWADTGPGFDPYVAERDYNPMKQGTFWGKFRARQPFLRGRPMRLIRGFVGQTLSEMETRHYLIDGFSHDADDGSFQITAKDLLKFADDDRAQAPVASRGFLVNDILAADTSAQLSPSGIGDEDYPATGYVNIGGKEIAAFDRDPTSGNDADTKLLIHFDSNTFPDSSSSGKTVQINAAVQFATAIKWKGAGSGFWDGAGGDQLFLADHADWTPAGDFTVECRCRFGTMVSIHTLFLHATDGNNRYFCQVAANGAISFSIVSASVTILTMTSAAGVIEEDATHPDFYHIAVVRNGNDWRIYVDGVSVAQVTSAVAIPNFTSLFRIGINQAGSNSFIGWMDEFRFSHVARWTTDFTPPVSAYQTNGDIIELTRGQLSTTAQDHDASDRVQLVLIYEAEDVADIIYDLLVTYADVDPVYLPLATWKIETASFLDRVFSAIIAEPVGVQTLINELIEDAALVIWWDDLTPELRLRVLRQIAVDAFTFDQSNYMIDTFGSKEQPNERISQVWRFFAKRSPVERHDNEDNYRSLAVTIDLQAETDYGSKVIKKIYSRWIPFGGRSIADKANDLYLSRYRDPPRAFQFSVFRNGLITPELGLGYRIKGTGLQNDIGEAISSPIQIIRLNPSDTQFDLEAQEMLVTGEPEDLINRVIVIDSNVFNINLRDLHDTLYPAPTDQDVIDGVNLKCYIDPNVIVGAERAASGSGNVADPAFDVGSWPSGFPITLIINGKIEGSGGRGGTQAANRNGQHGGTALYTRHAIDIEVSTGFIWGGGGGGGAGGTRFNSGTGVGTPGCGGGGGAGVLFGFGGLGSGFNGVFAENGFAGTESAGGAGGTVNGNDGGAGGGPGAAGAAGQLSGSGATTNPAGSGGGAGNSIDGVSFVTITVGPGSVLGPQIN